MDFYVRTPDREIVPGVRTFILPASSEHSWEYIVKYGSETKQYWCSCLDFFHRRSVLHDECKHIRMLKTFIRAVGGLRNIKRGETCRISQLTHSLKSQRKKTSSSHEE